MLTLLKLLAVKLILFGDLQALSDIVIKTRQLLTKLLTKSPLVKPVLAVYFYSGHFVVLTWLDLGFVVLWASLTYAALLL